MIDCTLGTDSCLQMFNGGRYVKWEVLQDIAMFGINSVQVLRCGLVKESSRDDIITDFLALPKIKVLAQ